MKLVFITTRITTHIAKYSLLLFLCFSCTRLVDKTPDKVAETSQEKLSQEEILPQVESPEKIRLKSVTNYLKFIASLEREILKLLMLAKAPATNQFDVVVFGFEKMQNKHYGNLKNFDCQKINIVTTSKKFEIFSECLKPAKLLADITQNNNQFNVHFYTKNWGQVIGQSAGFSEKDRQCIFSIKNNKVQSFDCENSVFSLQNSVKDLSLFELKLKKYIFNRSSNDEILIEGAEVKDLLEVKKISLKIPLSGKIKIIEKQLNVKDEFIDLQNKLLGETPAVSEATQVEGHQVEVQVPPVHTLTPDEVDQSLANPDTVPPDAVKHDPVSGTGTFKIQTGEPEFIEEPPATDQVPEAPVPPSAPSPPSGR